MMDNPPYNPLTSRVHTFWREEVPTLGDSAIARPGDRRPSTEKATRELESVGEFSLGQRVSGITDAGRDPGQEFSGTIGAFIPVQGSNQDTVKFLGLVFLDEPVPSLHGKLLAIKEDLDRLKPLK